MVHRVSGSFDLLVTNGTVLTMAPGAEPIVDGAVAIRAGAIVAVGAASEIASAGRPARVIDAEGGLILPGFVNAHTHLAMVLLRGLADDLPLEEWLQDHIWPAEARVMTAGAVGVGTRWAAIESLKAGVTTVCDMYFHGREIAEAVAEVGLRAVLTEGLLDVPTPSCPSPEDAISRQRELLVGYRGHPLVIPSVAPHAPFTVSSAFLVREAELAAEFGVPLHIHLSETEREVEESRKRTGLSPVAYVESLGVLSERVVAAHCVHVDDQDLDLLTRHGVAVATVPASNLKLGSGVAPVPAMLERGLRVGIGTDGAASNDTLDVLRDAQLLALLHKGLTGDPAVLPARQVVEMATAGGARALGLGDRLGTLEPGKGADLVVLSLAGTHSMPVYDPFSYLAYAARSSDVRHVVVDGRVVVEERRVLTVDEASVRGEVASVTSRLRR